MAPVYSGFNESLGAAASCQVLCSPWGMDGGSWGCPHSSPTATETSGEGDAGDGPSACGLAGAELRSGAL